MDFAYSPHRESGGTMHLPSPTHPHTYRLDGTHFSSIQQLRRSLSRSPSKPSRFTMRQADSPRSPISPLALSRAFTPKTHKPASPIAAFPEAPAAATAPAGNKKKFALRRSAPFRSSPRNRTTSKSPRRALGDAPDLGNSTPFMSKRAQGEENSSSSASRRTSSDDFSASRFELNDAPIEFKFARPRHDSSTNNTMHPPKSSPLKRMDASMSQDQGHGHSPVAKRRSLHGASAFGAPAESPTASIFDQSPAPATPATEETPRRDTVIDFGTPFSFASSPVATNNTSPVRRASSVRKNTPQRPSPAVARPKPEGEFALPGLAASKMKSNRYSLDSNLAYGMGSSAQTPMRKSSNIFEFGRVTPMQPSLRGSSTLERPSHPLSYSMRASSSSSSAGGDDADNMPARPASPGPTTFDSRSLFSKSLPIGAARPTAAYDSNVYATPASFNKFLVSLKANQTTGALTKKTRDINEAPTPNHERRRAPGTPSKHNMKRNSFPPSATHSPIGMGGNLFGKSTHDDELNSSPFSLFKDPSRKIFALKGDNSTRRRSSSFSSILGADSMPNSPSGMNSPIAMRMSDSQSSIDDMPPTPTKAHDGRRSKENSLRRKTFGRQRTSLGNNTFDTSELHSGTPFNQSVISFGAPSPHTPDEPLAMPDTSKLSISGPRRGSLNFNSSLNSNGPPATPTTPRELDFFAAEQAFTAALGLPDNDIDVSLTERFFHVSKLDEFGEFSEVYRVEDPVGGCARPEDRVTVVKKSNKPFTGQFDRRKKMREVEALKAVRGNEHVLRYIEHWEFESNLYIQTEYCEGGTLKKFIEPNFHPDRLDDFRIWKILLELSMGLQHIHDKGFMHLDLKPENIFIDFEGILKIADFGLAAAWPAPPHLDAEGDRSYLAPETMDGHPDKPSDIFALGVMMIEIGGNYPIPHFGERWYDLRHGRFRLPSLTWSNASSTLSRDSSGEPIARNHGDSLPMSDFDAPFEGERLPLTPEEEEELLRAPFFMVDETHEHALNQVVQAMVNPDPEQRPTAEQIFSCFGCQWVLERRRAGATIYEGNFGPSQENLGVLELDDEVDAMDMS